MTGLSIAGKSKSSTSIKICIYILLTVLTIVSAFPLYIMLINTTRSNTQIMNGISFIPSTFLVQNYLTAKRSINLWIGFKNSAIISVSSTLLSAYVSSLTAYGLSQYRFKGRAIFFSIVVGMMMIPGQLGLIGFFELVDFFKLLDTYFPLIFGAGVNPFAVFFITQYTKQTLPQSIVESARLDGASEFHIYHYIALPIMTPAIATMSIFTFVFSWNNLMGPLILIHSQEKYTLPMLMAILRSRIERADFGAFFFAMAVSIVPIMIAYAFCSKYLISGLTMGSVKE